MKEEILKKAVDLFLNFGFKSITMDDIARDLAISKKTIYSHFSTKLKLVKASTFYVFEQVNTGICSICTVDQNPIEEIYLIKSLVMKQLKGEKSSPQYQLQKYYPKIFEALKQKQFESVNECITKNLKNGIEQGFYRKGIDINLITRLYFNGIMGIKNVELFPTDTFSNTYLMNSYLEYHIRAIATEKGLKTLNEIIKK
ncbi:MAG: TetR/AcrR family transcriptional regulator [Flavobacteriaceae bacterium]|nr:TetR/AcrR family transcriptional regulator [Flavobacteriaceae bacterium]